MARKASRSHYDPRNVLKQAPEELRDWVLTILAVLVIVPTDSPVLDVSPEAVTIIGLVVYKTLTVFYVKPAQKAKVETEKAKTEADLKALNEELEK